MRKLVVLSGSSHPTLAKQIVERLGMDLGDVFLGKFENQETRVEIQQNVRDQDVFIVQSGCGKINDALMELLILIHACKIACSRRITAVIPCFPYSRQPDIPYKINNKYDMWYARPGTLVANLLVNAGVNHIITMDLHDAQFQGFFDIPVDNLRSQPLMIRYIQEHIPDYHNAVIVSPDSGGAKRATDIATKLELDFGLVHKDRKKKGNSGEELIFVGDVTGKVAIIVDDIADTGRTLLQATEVLIKNGATKVYALVTHGILSGDVLELIEKSELTELIVSKTIPQEEHTHQCSKLRTFQVAPIFAEAIRRIHNGESVSYLFDHAN